MNKSTEEKIYLRILVKSDLKSGNKHSYIFEQRECGDLNNRGISKYKGKILDCKSIFKRILYVSNNRYEVKLRMGLFGLNKIKKYHLYHNLNGTLSYCLIEFED